MALMMGITDIWYEPAAVWLMIGRGRQCREHRAVSRQSPVAMATARSHSVVPNPKISAEVRGSKTHSRLATTDIHLASCTKTTTTKKKKKIRISLFSVHRQHPNQVAKTWISYNRWMKC